MRKLFFALWLAVLGREVLAADCRGLWVERSREFAGLSNRALLETASQFYAVEVISLSREDQGSVIEVISLGGTPDEHEREQATRILDEMIARIPLRVAAYLGHRSLFQVTRDHWFSGKQPHCDWEKTMFATFSMWAQLPTPWAQTLVRKVRSPASLDQTTIAEGRYEQPVKAGRDAKSSNTLINTGLALSGFGAYSASSGDAVSEIAFGLISLVAGVGCGVADHYISEDRVAAYQGQLHAVASAVLELRAQSEQKARNYLASAAHLEFDHPMSPKELLQAAEKLKVDARAMRPEAVLVTFEDRETALDFSQLLRGLP